MNKENNYIENYLDKIKNYLDTKELDYYDIRVDNNKSTNIIIDKKDVKEVIELENKGIGIRIYKNKKLGFCSTNIFENYKKIIDKCIEDTKKQNKITLLSNFSQNKNKFIVKHKKFEDKDIESKTKELLELNKELLKKDIKEFKLLETTLRYSEITKRNYFLSPYAKIYEEKPFFLLYNFITGSKNNNIESTLSRTGYLGGLEKRNYDSEKEIINENILQLDELLNSKPCPATTADIILAPDVSDLLSHEAIGHSLEADAVIRNESVLKKGMLLTKNQDVNITDNPEVKEFGYYKYDQEGILAKKRELIKKGIVNDYLLDLESSTKLKLKPNGAARAESYAQIPIPRMSNTYFETGKDKYKDLRKDFNGYLLKGFSGGQTYPNIGTFMFGIKQAYKYKDGEIVNKYKQASISGNISKYLKNIEGVSNKAGKELNIGFCGKGRQTAFVGGKNPYLKIKNIVIGGTKHE